MIVFKHLVSNSYRSPILILLISLLIINFPATISTRLISVRSNIDEISSTRSLLDNGSSLKVDNQDVLSNPYSKWWSNATSYSALFAFGDSLTDTGNGPFVNKLSAISYPFGITFPGYPIGRFSDGYIILDYLAMYLSLPLVNPWLDVFLNFTQGANYAIPGASISPNLGIPFILSKQISWHLDLVQQVTAMSTTSRKMMVENMEVNESSTFQGMPKLKSNLPSQKSLQEALYVLQFGVVDYKVYVVDYNYSVEWVNTTIVPLVINEIQIALERLYDDGGARNFLVIGSPAQGCLSATLATLPSSTKDSHGCVASLNDITWNHNQQLLNLLKSLRELHVDATYTLLDFFAATIYIIDHAKEFGFTNAFDACCGAGDRYPYGFNSTEFLCSSQTTSLYVCKNPNDYINWDGSHFTTNFYAQLFNLTFVTKSFIYEF